MKVDEEMILELLEESARRVGIEPTDEQLREGVALIRGGELRKYLPILEAALLEWARRRMVAAQRRANGVERPETDAGFYENVNCRTSGKG